MMIQKEKSKTLIIDKYIWYGKRNNNLRKSFYGYQPKRLKKKQWVTWKTAC